MAESKAVLLSGGLDSTALCYWMRPQKALVIDYGQVSAAGEVRAAKAVSEAMDIPFFCLKVDCRHLGSGLLANRSSITQSPSPEWWPFRNQLLASLAGSWAITQGINEILFGTVASDGFHKDGTPDFFDLLNRLMRYQEGDIQISVPAIHLTAIELVFCHL